MDQHCGVQMAESIVMESVVKTFGDTRALDGVDLTVHEGEVHGFLGPNGAGKSTAIRVLLGLLRPDAGHVQLLGGDPWDDAVSLHRRLAYVPGDVELWPNLTGGEIIDIFARLRGSADRERRDDLCERFSLDPTKQGRTYSKGNRQKVALISALASNVELLLLDEPTAGLDPLMEATFQEYIRTVQQQGMTVLLSSHILAQVEALADRVSIIREGRIVESGSLEALRHLHRVHFTISTSQSPQVFETMQGVHNVSTSDAFNRRVTHRDQDAGFVVEFEVDRNAINGVLGSLAAIGVTDIEARPPTLEQLLLRHYGDQRDIAVE